MYESLTHFVHTDLVNSWIKNDTDFDIFNWTTWVLLITFILALLVFGSTIIVRQRYNVIMLAITSHKANALSLSPPSIFTYTCGCIKRTFRLTRRTSKLTVCSEIQAQISNIFHLRKGKSNRCFYINANTIIPRTYANTKQFFNVDTHV